MYHLPSRIVDSGSSWTEKNCPYNFHQPVTCKASCQLVLNFSVALFCLLVCVTAFIMYAIITSHTLLPCKFTLVDLMAALNTGVATVSSLAQIRV